MKALLARLCAYATNSDRPADDDPIAPPPVRYCVDCRHRVAHPLNPQNADLDMCHAPQNVTINLVNGKGAMRLSSCSAARGREFEGYCGRVARWFEPKQPLKNPAQTEEKNVC